MTSEQQQTTTNNKQQQQQQQQKDQSNVGKIQTVQGLIFPEQLGKVMMHEHLLIEFTQFFQKPSNEQEAKEAEAPITLENLHSIQYHINRNWKNLLLDDIQTSVSELNFLKLNDVSTLVEVTTRGIRLKTGNYSSPEQEQAANREHALALKTISEQTGINIVMGAGFYVDPTLPKHVGLMSDDELAVSIVNELEKGIDIGNGQRVKAGIIGEIGCSYPITELEKRLLKAAASAQQKTGASVNIHPGRDEKCPFEIIEFLKKEGADLSRVVMSHIDRTLFHIDQMKDLAASGCVLEFDLFGLEISNYSLNPRRYMPSDEQRIEYIVSLVRSGFGKQIVVSHDIYSKHRLVQYGGHGYSHIVKNIVPRFRIRGLSDHEIHQILEATPRRLLTFV